MKPAYLHLCCGLDFSEFCSLIASPINTAFCSHESPKIIGFLGVRCWRKGERSHNHSALMTREVHLLTASSSFLCLNSVLGKTATKSKRM